jgi:hypothetical protein
MRPRKTIKPIRKKNKTKKKGGCNCNNVKPILI